MDKAGAKAERGYPGPTRGIISRCYPFSDCLWPWTVIQAGCDSEYHRSRI